MGEKENGPFQFTFNGLLKVAFQGSHITSDAGLILVRELDERLGLEQLITDHLSDSRHGTNTQFRVADLLRQSVYSRLAGYEDLNDAVRLSTDPTFRLIGSPKRWDRTAALTSTLHWFETELLTREGNLVGLMALNRDMLAQTECVDHADRVVLDMDSSESPVHGQQEGSAYNGHFESVCYHPLFLFNGHGDCLAAKLRSGNVHSADDWDELLLPEIVAFRADRRRTGGRRGPRSAWHSGKSRREAFATTYQAGIYREAKGAPRGEFAAWNLHEMPRARYKRDRLGNGKSPTCCSGLRDGPVRSRWSGTRAFTIRRAAGRYRDGSWRKSSTTRASCSRASGSS